MSESYATPNQRVLQLRRRPEDSGAVLIVMLVVALGFVLLLETLKMNASEGDRGVWVMWCVDRDNAIVLPRPELVAEGRICWMPWPWAPGAVSWSW